MQVQKPEHPERCAPFGRRKVRPRACVVDASRHVRRFLTETLADLGFVTCEWQHDGDLPALLDARVPDLVVIGLSPDPSAAGDVVKTLAGAAFGGQVLLFGQVGLLAMTAVHELGEKLGLAMLPLLKTTFDQRSLRDHLAALLPVHEPPTAPVDVAEALDAGWLELWYQPKIDARTLKIGSAEALIRMRHPTWGVVPPAYFIPDDGDPHFAALSDFVIGQAIRDWRCFVIRHGHVTIAINLPFDFLQDRRSVRRLCRQMPVHPAFKGLTVEINGTEALRHWALLQDIGRQLQLHNIGLSIDDLGAEWPSFVDMRDFPFVEIKVDRKFVSMCASDRLKQMICRRIIDLAETVGARTVAEGVETKDDFDCVREMGFDLVQGFLFAEPMPVHKFTQCMRHGVASFPQ
jgi:EAL domain-containing protein (putative c-di-GMP-specific phosphodiesterase class I)